MHGNFFTVRTPKGQSQEPTHCNKGVHYHTDRNCMKCTIFGNKWAVSNIGVCQKRFDYIPEIISLSYCKTEMN